VTLVGAHTPSGDPLAEAEVRGADLVQIFLSNPQSWKKPLPRDDAAALRNSPILVYVHAPYLINVCADNNRVRIPSRKILQDTCDAAADINAAAVVVHGAWGDKALARRVEWIARLWEEIGGFGVGLVLDTCHSWAGGEPFDGLVERVLDATGRIDLVHANDSKDLFDSRRDRHQNLGKGEIPSEDLARAIASADAPVVVETPGGADDHADDIEWVRQACADTWPVST